MWKTNLKYQSKNPLFKIIFIKIILNKRFLLKFQAYLLFFDVDYLKYPLSTYRIYSTYN